MTRVTHPSGPAALMRVLALLPGLGLLLFGTPAAASTDPLLLTPPPSVRLFDARFEPVGATRFSIVHTLAKVQYAKVDGAEHRVDSADAPRTLFGHRRGFVLDSVQLGAEGRFHDLGLYYSSRVELFPRAKTGQGSSDYLNEALLGWNRYTVFNIQLGQMALPFGRAAQLQPTQRPMSFSPTLDALVPERQLGLVIDGGDPWGAVRLYAGAHHALLRDGDALDDFDRLVVTGRLELRIDRLLRALRAHPGLDFQLTLGGSVAWVSRHLSPETEHRWVGADLQLRLWRFTVGAEFVIKDFYFEPLPTDSSRPQRGWGWHTDLSVVLVPTWLDLSVRVEESDGDEEVRGATGALDTMEGALQRKRWFTAGLTLHLADHGAVLVHYIHRQELEGLELHNDVFLVTFQGEL